MSPKEKLEDAIGDLPVIGGTRLLRDHVYSESPKDVLSLCTEEIERLDTLMEHVSSLTRKEVSPVACNIILDVWTSLVQLRDLHEAAVGALSVE